MNGINGNAEHHGLMQSESFSEAFRVTVSVLCSIKFKIVMCLIQKFKNAYQLP